MYLDTNGNHTIDGSDTFLPGVTVTLGGASSASQASTSGPVPSYKFSDLALANYTVSAPAQAFGYALSSSTPGTQTANLVAPNNDVTGIDFLYEPASLSGTIYVDKDDNGIISGGDEILNGVQVDLTSATNANTTANGSASPTYKFLGLQGGPYSVAVAGTFGGYKLAPATASPKTGSLTAGGSVTGVDFLYVRGRLSGYAYVDSDNDGTKDVGEPALAGVIITVPGLPAATTDANGYYSYKGLGANAYSVSASTPASGYALSTAPTLNPNVTEGADVKDVNFGYRPGGLSGFAYVDMNRDGVKNPGEPGLANVSVVRTGSTTPAITDSNGWYGFSNLVANTYSMAAPQSAAGYVVSTTNPLSTTLAAGGSVANLNFGYVPGSISGFTYLDTNNNGVKDSGEQGLAGVTVTLSGSPTRTTVSASNGSYSFANVLANTYSDSAPTTASGYNRSTPSPLTVVVAAGQNVTDKNFGYRDTTLPVCAVYATSWGGTMTFQDTGSGIKYLDVTKNLNNNFNVQISPSPSSFNPSVPSQPWAMPTGERGTYSTPTTQLITVTATRRNSSQSAQLIVNATDVFGNVITCDPVLTTVTKLRNDNGVQTFTDLPFDEHNVTIENNNPGLRGMDVIVNGVEFRVRGMEDNEVRELNVRRAMRHNNTNTITLIPRGRKGESADVTIAAPDWED